MSASVLIVEDDRELRDLVRRYLERAGHAVQTSGTGAETLGMLANGGIDLMVLDFALPGVDGVEPLVAAHDRGSDVPVVVPTAREVGTHTPGGTVATRINEEMHR
jgi:two-component system alkaline phosphatase synthesis response regulator PhoP